MCEIHYYTYSCGHEGSNCYNPDYKYKGIRHDTKCRDCDEMRSSGTYETTYSNTTATSQTKECTKCRNDVHNQNSKYCSHHSREYECKTCYKDRAPNSEYCSTCQPIPRYLNVARSCELGDEDKDGDKYCYSCKKWALASNNFSH